MNIVEILHDQARRRATAPAIIDVAHGADRIISFAELDAASARGAALLLKSGLKRGDTVLVFQPMSAELYIALLALFRLGMTAMFLDPSAGRDHIARCCAIRPPAALISSPKAQLLRLISPALRRIPHHFVFGHFIPGAIPWSRADRLAPHQPIAPGSADVPALITFTSGSTGQPKAAVRSHGFLLAQHQVLEKAIHLTPGAIDLTTLPIFVLANLASGVTSLLPDADLRRPGAIRPETVLAQIKRFRPTSVVASPAFVERLCDGCQGSGRTIDGFRHVFTGGAPVFPDHLERFAANFPGAEVVAVYGSTEAEPIAHIARQELSAADMTAMSAGSGLLAGVPIPEITVRVMGTANGQPLGRLSAAEFAERCRPVTEGGEIVVSGAHVLHGYLLGVGDEETKFRVDGQLWHRTGDFGYFDNQGRLWLLGRASAIINDSRGTLHPFTVECAARPLPGVQRAALLGRNGQRILYVQPRQGERVDTKQLRESLSWAQLDEVRTLREIPLDKRHNAKVDYTRLR
jgi:acyl-CoA synthetase (AMP-forming)/AMP-acid ligase II